MEILELIICVFLIVFSLTVGVAMFTVCMCMWGKMIHWIEKKLGEPW